MRIQDKKRAYTLAEIMLVILVLTIIFAAMAPIFTKRKITSYSGKYNVWTASGSNSTGDAFFDPEDPSLSGELFFGITPNNGTAVQTQFAPLSKMVIRAGRVTAGNRRQHHLQFRYGRKNDNKAGDFAGTWYLNRRNMLLGGSYVKLEDSEQTGAVDNVAVGFGALDNIKTATGNVAVGYKALGSSVEGKDNVAIGYKAGFNAGVKKKSSENVFIGQGAGENYSGKNAVFIGYHAGKVKSGELATVPQNKKNLAVGAFAGGGLVPDSEGKVTGKENTAIGYKALANVTSGDNNIAIGFQALANLTTGNNNVAIGYNACQHLTTESNKTCIGYNSGPRKKSDGNKGSAFLLWDDYGNGSARGDSVERTYIGAPPKNYGGDAVLEIHNPNTEGGHAFAAGTSSSLVYNTTTVVNGNLIIRGRPYFTSGQNLQHFHNNKYFAQIENGVNKGYLYYYGYFTKNDAGYASCGSDIFTYQFGNAKCPNFNSSDRRLKNISDRYTAGLKELKQIKVYNFTFKNDKNKTPQVGVIAQELREVFPTAVFTDESGYLKIRWEEMFYAVINAVKELDKKIVSLVKRATKVETQISKLEQENETLKAQVNNLRERVNKLKEQ